MQDKRIHLNFCRPHWDCALGPAITTTITALPG